MGKLLNYIRTIDMTCRTGAVVNSYMNYRVDILTDNKFSMRKISCKLSQLQGKRNDQFILFGLVLASKVIIR